MSNSLNDYQNAEKLIDEFEEVNCENEEINLTEFFEFLEKKEIKWGQSDGN
jgi:hypothetical protein